MVSFLYANYRDVGLEPRCVWRGRGAVWHLGYGGIFRRDSRRRGPSTTIRGSQSKIPEQCEKSGCIHGHGNFPMPLNLLAELNALGDTEGILLALGGSVAGTNPNDFYSRGFNVRYNSSCEFGEIRRQDDPSYPIVVIKSGAGRDIQLDRCGKVQRLFLHAFQPLLKLAVQILVRNDLRALNQTLLIKLNEHVMVAPDAYRLTWNGADAPRRTDPPPPK